MFQIMMIAGEGMPKYGNSARRGNLHIHFVVDFPTELTAEQKAGMIDALNDF
jgi:DnaJ-class molecular chaperone